MHARTAHVADMCRRIRPCKKLEPQAFLKKIREVARRAMHGADLHHVPVGIKAAKVLQRPYASSLPGVASRLAS